MKNIIIGIVIGILMACTTAVAEYNGLPSRLVAAFNFKGSGRTHARTFELKGHEYIIAGGYGVGLSMIHAEHCSCKK